jgi:MoaA/NifB/PqqE/SkfB family radical SAM enzyme
MKTLLAVLSEKCNLNCSYCGVDKWSKKRIDADLYLEEFKKLREQFPTE